MVDEGGREGRRVGGRDGGREGGKKEGREGVLSGHQVSPLEGVTSQCDVTAQDLPFVPIYK